MVYKNASHCNHSLSRCPMTVTMTRIMVLEELEDSRERAYRFIAYAATIFSFIAILSTCLTVPMVNNYVNSLHERVNVVLMECRNSAEAILVEADAYERVKNGEREWNRTMVRRQAAPACSGCCLPGDPGPQGKSGKAGKPGKPGAPGATGPPGPPPKDICIYVNPPPCNACPPGKPGPAGPVGPDGGPGKPGENGQSGKDGTPGAKGPPGEHGPVGPIGGPGLKGEPGPTPPTDEIPGDPGPPGQDGASGSPGVNGTPGQNGPSGPAGQKGSPGRVGSPGNNAGTGPRGPPGADGPKGNPGVCPKYCAMDGGIFFEDGTLRR